MDSPKAFPTGETLPNSALIWDAILRGSVVDELHQANRRRVLGHQGIGGQQQDALGDGLGYQQAVEGVLVERWQRADDYGMLTSDRQFPVAMIQQAAPQQMGIHLEIIPAQRPLDTHFPQIHRTEQHFVQGIAEQSAPGSREAVRCASGP